MTLDEQFRYWLKGAEDDLVVADSLYNQGHYSWCLFIGHLVLEKTLKGLFLKATGETPPKTHNLLYLAEKAGINLSKEQHDFLVLANTFNIEGRYPDNGQAYSLLSSKPFTTEQFDRIKEMRQWLLQQVKA